MMSRDVKKTHGEGEVEKVGPGLEAEGNFDEEIAWCRGEGRGAQGRAGTGAEEMHDEESTGRVYI